MGLMEISPGVFVDDEGNYVDKDGDALAGIPPDADKLKQAKIIELMSQLPLEAISRVVPGAGALRAMTIGMQPPSTLPPNNKQAQTNSIANQAIMQIARDYVPQKVTGGKGDYNKVYDVAYESAGGGSSNGGSTAKVLITPGAKNQTQSDSSNSQDEYKGMLPTITPENIKAFRDDNTNWKDWDDKKIIDFLQNNTSQVIYDKYRTNTEKRLPKR